MTYDDWKATDLTPEPEREGWCDVCEHYECDCPCCTEPPVYACDQCGAEAGEIMVAGGYCGGPCECGGEVRCRAAEPLTETAAAGKEKS